MHTIQFRRKIRLFSWLEQLSRPRFAIIAKKGTYLCLVNIVFYGTPEFAAHALLKIHESGFNIVGVVTAPDKPAGRGQKLQSSAVKITAESLGLPVFQPVNLKSQEFASQLVSMKPDIGVVIAFRMLPEKVWNFPTLGTVNLHASLLPDYRGAAPIQHAIINGETETGLSTFFLKHEIDTGDIIDQVRVSISSVMDAGELHDILMQEGAKLMVNSLRKIEKFGLETPCIPQNNKGISQKIAPKINREFCQLNAHSTPVEAFNKIRGLSPYPGAWIPSPWGDMKIFECKLVPDMTTKIEGVSIVDKKIYLGLNGGVLEILLLQIPGKSRMKSSDFLNGISK